LFVAEIDVAHDGVAQGFRAPVGATFDLLPGELGKPAFDEIQLGGTGRGEVQMDARMTQQPAVNHGRFVGRVIVENQVHVEGRRHRGVNAIEKLTKLLRPMAGVTGADNGAGLTSRAANSEVVPWRT